MVPAFSTHQRAGEITFRHKTGLTYEATILTYTFAPSPADRPKLTMNWGDGTSSEILRTEMIDLPDDIRRNVYVGEHTFNGNGEYLLSVEDPNRNYGVLNLPNSVNTPLFIQTLLVINPFFAPNNSPQLLLPPIDNGCTNFPYLHNPGVFDADGDSISYKLVPCRGAGGQVVPGYVLPNQVGNNIGGLISLDTYSGDFLWDSPKQQGEYNIAILIEEFRNGIRIGFVVRDMQIIIQACNNQPPVIDPIPDTCVIAGEAVQFNVVANDPDGHKITLTGTGGPFMVSVSPAIFDQPVSGNGSVSQVFKWYTVCEHVRLASYPVYFKAKDNGFPVNLVDIETVNITVIGPPVQNLTTTPWGNSIILNWNQSPCANATGYKIYRRNGYYGYTPAYCETGVPEYTGYKEIASLNGLSTTTYTDDNTGAGLIHGIDYCYMVIAVFPDGAQSIASEEVCTTLKRDLPIITKVSITKTDAATGTADIEWVKPTELDFSQTPGPFKYMIYRAHPAGSAFVLIDSLDGLTDTNYSDVNLNTAENQLAYRIGLLNNTPGNRFMVGYTQTATSVFLKIAPTDQALVLGWNYAVPWSNDTMVIYRQNPLTLLFDSIAFTTGESYRDTGLVNGQTYCYKLKSVGAYSDSTLPAPLWNLSQENCARPVDNVAPCVPTLSVAADCDQIEHLLSWTTPDPECAADIQSWNIWYAAQPDLDYTLLVNTGPANLTSWLHTDLQGIAGCYAITAIDSSGNESLFSNKVCIDIDTCPTYHLPNVFTPNHDLSNDVFRPFPYTSVERIDLTIFNRWGSVVFKTTDPEINWDGKDMNTHQDCSEGVYFYVCDVYERRLSGLSKRLLSGPVHLLRK